MGVGQTCARERRGEGGRVGRVPLWASSSPQNRPHDYTYFNHNGTRIAGREEKVDIKNGEFNMKRKR